MTLSKRLLTCTALVAALAASQTATAATIFPLVGGAPTGVNYLNFDDLALGFTASQPTTGPNGSVTVNMTQDAQAVTGSSSGLYAAPFLSGGNGAAFGNPITDGQDSTKYLTSGSNPPFTGAQVELVFTNLQAYFGLLWGSVDLYNTLTFYDGATVVDTVTGGDINALANGDQGANGTFYVNILPDFDFDRVVATSSQYAFEFDNVAYNDVAPNPTGVPDGGTTAVLLGLALSGMGLLRRRMR